MKRSGKKNKRQEPVPNVIGELNEAVLDAVSETTDLLTQSGPLKSGSGLASGVLALTLAFLCLLGVAAFHFPQYLTTPELRRQYSPEFIRHMMFASLVLAGSISVLNVLFRNNRGLNAIAGVMVLVCLALGGSDIPVADFADHTPYIGLDWFILDLLGSTLIFVAIEKLFPLYKGQVLFRKEWQTDMVHFTVNHFLVGLALLTVNFAIHRLFGWMGNESVQALVQSLYLSRNFYFVF